MAQKPGHNGAQLGPLLKLDHQLGWASLGEELGNVAARLLQVVGRIHFLEVVALSFPPPCWQSAGGWSLLV